MPDRPADDWMIARLRRGQAGRWISSAAILAGLLASPPAHAGDGTRVVRPPTGMMRLDAKDRGRVLRHGDGPDRSDHLGAREPSVFEHQGTYYLHYDGAGPRGWRACLATSRDLIAWTKHGPVLDLGAKGEVDSGTASSPWVIHDGPTWHMFYVASPNTTPAPDFVPAVPYLTSKARSDSPRGPWIKQKDVIPFRPGDLGPAYSPRVVVASPGMVVKLADDYLMFFSWGGDRPDGAAGPHGNVGLARTRNLDGRWSVEPRPILPGEDGCENSSLYFEPASRTWFLFTNHVKPDGTCTDAVWVYWSDDPTHWDPARKAVVLDGQNCTWSRRCVGMPSVIPVGGRLALIYDAPGAESTRHMNRDIGLAWLDLPLIPPDGDPPKR